MQDASGITVLDDLAFHYSNLEAKNFELFNSCNQANDRVGDMQKQLKALQVGAVLHVLYFCVFYTISVPECSTYAVVAKLS